MINKTDIIFENSDIIDIVVYHDYAMVKRSKILKLNKGENLIVFKTPGLIIKDSIKTYIPDDNKDICLISTSIKDNWNEFDQQEKKIQNVVEIVIHCHAVMETTIFINYFLKKAYWYVSYTARLNLQKSCIEFDYYGEIRQDTGENWDKTRISLSIRKIQTIIDIPQLYPIQLFSDNNSNNIEMASQEQPIKQKTDENTECESDFEKSHTIVNTHRTNNSDFNHSATNVDRNNCQIPGNVSIPSDNKWYKFKILNKTFSCKLSYETVPAVLEYVYLKANFKNNTKYPFFEGPVQVFKNKNYVGKSQIKFTAPEDSLKLSFGIDEDLKVKRTKLVDRILPARGLNLKNVREYKYEFILYNFKSNAQNVCLKEAIHRTKMTKIDIQILKESTKEYQLDKNGIIKWNIQLPSSSYNFKKLYLHYKITAPKNFDLTTL